MSYTRHHRISNAIRTSSLLVKLNLKVKCHHLNVHQYQIEIYHSDVNIKCHTRVNVARIIKLKGEK